jgi:hypothetical protein
VECQRIGPRRAKLQIDSGPGRGHRPLFMVLVKFPAMRCAKLVAIEAIAVYCSKPGPPVCGSLWGRQNGNSGLRQGSPDPMGGPGGSGLRSRAA